MPDDFDDRPRRRRDEDDDFDSPRRRDCGRDDDFDRPPPRKSGSRGLFIILGVVFAMLLVCGGGGVFAVISIRESANRMKSRNNLMQMGLAIRNYSATNGELPGNTYTADGKPLLSWRVHILPYIEQDTLYRRFKLDEPWDGPTNQRLLDLMPRTYQQPAAAVSTRLTHYRGFSSPGAVFSPKLVQGRRRGIDEMLVFDKFQDGLAATAMVVEAADPVEWTKPDDLDASPGKPFPAMGGSGKKFLLMRGDGSVIPVRSDIPEATLRGMVSYAGGEAPPALDED